ncbi:MAG: hypothetical protein WCI51_13085 [Lentisphaerota bacterium]
MKKNLVLLVICLCSYYTFQAGAEDSINPETYRKAAKAGDAKAQYNLGLCYFTGTGVSKFMETAVACSMVF